MPEQLANLTIGEIMIWMTSLTAVVVVVAKLWKPFKRLMDFLESWTGEAEQRDSSGKVTKKAVPGVPARLLQLELDVKKIHHEVTPNHGGSMNDGLKRVEASAKETGKVVEGLDLKLDEHVKIAKEKDGELDEIKKKLAKHIEDTEPWNEMLTDLHQKYTSKPE